VRESVHVRVHVSAEHALICSLCRWIRWRFKLLLDLIACSFFLFFCRHRTSLTNTHCNSYHVTPPSPSQRRTPPPFPLPTTTLFPPHPTPSHSPPRRIRTSFGISRGPPTRSTSPRCKSGADGWPNSFSRKGETSTALSPPMASSCSAPSHLGSAQTTPSDRHPPDRHQGLIPTTGCTSALRQRRHRSNLVTL
jgi:hypothetical protein